MPDTGRRVVVAGAAALVLVVSAVHVYRNVVLRPQDFHTVWTALHAFVAGDVVYSDDPGTGTFNHPPSSLVRHSPLGLVPEAVASRLLGVLNLALLAALVVVPARRFGRSIADPVVLGVLGIVIAVSVGVGGRGNTDALIAAMLLLSVELLVGGRDVGAGVALGLAFAMKPVVALVALVPVACRRWRVTALAAVVTATVIVVAVVVRPSSADFFGATVRYVLRGQFPGGDDSVDGSVNGLLVETLDWPAWLSTLVRAVIGLVVVAVLLRARETIREGADCAWATFALLASASLLAVGSYAYPYYFVYLVPAVAWLVFVGRPTVAAAVGSALVVVAVPRDLVRPAAESIGRAAEVAVDHRIALLFAVVLVGAIVELEHRGHRSSRSTMATSFE